MARILFYSEAWGKGGIETFIKSIIPLLVNNNHYVEIYSTWDWAEQDRDVLKDLGVKRTSSFHGYKPGQITRLFKGVEGFRRLLKKERFDAAWINTMNGMGFLYAREAQKAGIPIRVVHSHNSDVGEGAKALKRFAGRIGVFLWGRYSTKNVACSQDAGYYLFRDNEFEVIKNGIDIERFAYTEEKRNWARKEIGINKQTTLIGNIGRINSQKNPLFQVQVFSEYLKMDQDARYLFLGKPDMIDSVNELAIQLGIKDSIIILEPVENTAPFYCALDALLMPSLYEGLSFTEIEAQCAALPILSTNTLPKEGDITELAQHCSLDESPSTWASRLLNMIDAYRGRRSPAYSAQIKNAGFSVQDSSKSVLRILGGESK